MQVVFVAVVAWLLLFPPAARELVPPAPDLDPGFWERSPLPALGLATFYAPGLMDSVWEWRRERGQVPDCPDCVGAVALLRAGDIGRKIWLQPPGGELAGPFLVVDCAHPEDIPPLLDRNWVVDVSYNVGQLWGMAGPLDNVIVWADPGEEPAGNGAAAPAPRYIDPKDVVVSPPTPTPAAASTPTSWPTRRPAPLAGPAPSAAGEPARTPRPGPPTITAPTATPGPGGVNQPAAPSPPAQSGVARPPGVAAIGRPGQALLLHATPRVPLRATLRPAPPLPRATATATPTWDPARPTSPPILDPAAAPAAPSDASPDDVPALGRLWQALRRLLGG